MSHPVTAQLRSGELLVGRGLQLTADGYRLEVEAQPRDLPEADVLRFADGFLLPAGVAAPGLEPPPPRPPGAEDSAPDPSVRIEAVSLPAERRRAHLLASLLPTGAAPLYALVDGARVPDLLERLAERCARATCLYPVPPGSPGTATAPHLVPLEPGGSAATWLVSEGWGASWGCFLRSSTPVDALLRHLRRFLQVATPTGPVRLRYWDPRVLRVLLATLDGHEAATLFGGGIDELLVEHDHPDTLLRYRIGAAAVEPARVAWPLPLRPQVLAALAGDYVYRQHRAELTDHVQGLFTGQCARLGEVAVASAVRAAVSQAAGVYGLTEEYDLARFLNVAFFTHHRFWERPWARTWVEILDDAERDPEERMDAVWLLCKGQLAAEKRGRSA